MMKKRNTIIFGSIVAVLIITGVFASQKKDITPIEVEKQQFFITTQTLGKKELQGGITKSATVEGASDITINAQVAGRVTNTHVTLGQTVSSKQLLVSLSDSAGSYAFGAQRAALSVQSAQNSFAINQQNLLKQLQDAQIAYEKTRLSTDNSTLSNVNSSANLQLKLLEQNLAKSRIDYTIKLKTDEQTLSNFVNTAKNIYSDTNNLLLDVIDQTDKFLGYTIQNAHLNNGFEIYISVKNDSTKYIAEQKLIELIRRKDELAAVGNNITLENIDTFLTQYKDIVEAISEMSVAMKNVLSATTVGGTLTQGSLDGYVASFSALQSKASGISSSITAQVNTIDSFVNTYKDNQQSLKKQIESLETQIAVSKKQIEEASKNASYNLEQSKNNIDFITTTQSSNLNTLRNTLSQAQVAYQEAQFNLGKFSVSSPIAGIIGEILVDKGQEVTPGTPLVSMVSQGKEVMIRLSADEKMFVTLGQEVEVTYRGVIVPGNISEISLVADDTGNYPIKVTIDENAAVDIGMFVEVRIPLEQGNAIIPLNAVNIVDNNRGQIFLRDGNSIQTLTVALGSVYGDGVEITDELPEGTELIVSDISNYDPENMIIQKK